jgi:hypothetical protein
MNQHPVSLTSDTICHPSQSANDAMIRGDAAVLSLIGNSSLIPLRFEPEGVTLHVKCEFLNPSGSIKDRFAQCLVTDGLQRGLLRPGSIILECTSGQTGIALAIHHSAFVVSAADSGDFIQPGPYCDKPKKSTGAGDRFNAGCCFGLAHGLGDAAARAFGCAAAGFFVRHARSASHAELVEFLQQWPIKNP